MGVYFSRFYYQFFGYSPAPAAVTNEADGTQNTQNQQQQNDPCCSNSNSATDSAPNLTAFEPKLDTPQKVVRKNGAKIFAAYVPDSPERYAFSDFTELKTFLNSPVGKKKGTRFKQCTDDQDLDNFYTEQLSSSICTDELNESGGSWTSTEPDLPYKEIPARRLTEFRMAIEKRDNAKFDELLRESPRFLVNTSNDLPTILHIGMRCNALHIACRTSNDYAAKQILQLAKDTEWLRDAYATDACMRERSENLLDAMLNTPDKIENNTPLHYACRNLCEPIFKELIGHELCLREPVNSHDERPIDVLGRGAKGGTRQENKKVYDRMYVALEGSLPSIQIQKRRRSGPMAAESGKKQNGGGGSP